jgi:hypothetical protein
MDVPHLGSRQRPPALTAGAAQLGVEMLDISRCQPVESFRTDPWHQVSIQENSPGSSPPWRFAVRTDRLQPLQRQVGEGPSGRIPQTPLGDGNRGLGHGPLGVTLGADTPDALLAPPAVRPGRQVEAVEPRAPPLAYVLGHRPPAPSVSNSRLCPTLCRRHYMESYMKEGIPSRSSLTCAFAGVGGGTRDKTPREVGTTDLMLSAA